MAIPWQAGVGVGLNKGAWAHTRAHHIGIGVLQARHHVGRHVVPILAVSMGRTTAAAATCTCKWHRLHPAPSALPHTTKAYSLHPFLNPHKSLVEGDSKGMMDAPQNSKQDPTHGLALQANRQ